MSIKTIILAFISLYCWSLFSQEKKEYQINTIAFYNLENLFHPEDDPKTYDDDRTPNGKDHWTEINYTDKIKNMARVISEIGMDVTKNSPAIIGVAEIENRNVLVDLVNDQKLLPKNYGIVHFDSPDRRGIDVGLLYLKSIFKIKNKSTHKLLLYDQESGQRIYTRDQLLVSGYLDGDLSICKNHHHG